MKKILVLFVCVIFSTTVGHCIITNSDMTDETFLKNQNYSPSAIRLVKMQKYDTSPKNVEKKRGFARAWQKFNAYIDPAYENGDFGTQEIKFINTWDEI